MKQLIFQLIIRIFGYGLIAMWYAHRVIRPVCMGWVLDYDLTNRAFYKNPFIGDGEQAPTDQGRQTIMKTINSRDRRPLPNLSSTNRYLMYMGLMEYVGMFNGNGKSPYR